MTNRHRSFHVVATLALLWSLVTALAAPVGTALASARQGDAAIDPRGPGGGPPRDLTTELVVGETRYLFDRVVPVRRQDLTQIGAAEPLIVYARGDQPPFDRIYASVPPRDRNSVARYLPENLDAPDAPCLAEAAEIGSLDAGEAGTFAFAGFETDLTPDDLQEGGATPEGFPVYAGTEQPLAEIFIDAPEGLQRFVRTDDRGVPAILADDFAFDGRAFSFTSPAAGDATDLARIGCAGPFPLFAAPGEDQAPDEVVAVVAGQALGFSATGEDADATVVEAGDPEADTAETQPADQADGAEPVPAEAPIATPAAEETAAEPEATAAVEEEGQEETPAGADPATTRATGEFPRDLAVDDARYLLDRLVPPQEDLNEVDQQGDLTIFAPSEEEPFDRLYAAGGDRFARYLPQRLSDPDASCPAESANLGLIDGGESGQFVFAGVEPDLTPDDLQEVATTADNQRVYAETADSFTELFVTDNEGLLRYVALDEQGLPELIGPELPFGDQTFTFVEETTDIDRAALAGVGCAGPFPVFAAPDADEGPFTDLYLSVANRLFRFRSTETVSPATPAATETPSATEATEVPAETATPSPAATEVPPTAPISPAIEPRTGTPIPTEEPTSTPAPTATPMPTNTPEPTATPMPTSTGVPTSTTVPTATAVPPTSTPALMTTPVPTATTPAATAAPAPEASATPSDTPAPPAATETMTPAPASSTAEPQAVEPTAKPQAAEPTAVPLDALPAQLEVQNTTYDLVEAEGRVDTQGLAEVDVVQVQNQNVTIYAEQNVQGIVGPLYATAAGGRLVGRYVPAAVAAPTPPPSLPPTVQVEGATYIFNEVETNINVQNLVQVEVVQVQNTDVTIYAEQNVRGRPVRLFGVADDGRVVGQYIETAAVQQAQRTRRPRPFRSAVAATPPTNVQPAAATAIPRPNVCSGAAVPLDANGLPRGLPTRVQLGGVSYAFVRVEEGDPGTLTRIGCVGPFEAVSSDGADASEVIYLRIPGTAEGQGNVYRYEAIATVDVELQVTGRPQTITLRPVADRPAATYSVRAAWPRSVYSSITVILYAEDPNNRTPPLLYAYDVDDDVVGEYAPEGETQETSREMRQAAEANGLNPDLVLAGGQRYILTAVWQPSGSTANGWVTFYSADPGGTTDVLLGRDPRLPELLIYRRSG